MNKDKYVNIPISRKSREILKDLADLMKFKYGKFMGYDEVIEELARNIKLNDEFIRQQTRLIERNGQQVTYTKTMERKRNGH